MDRAGCSSGGGGEEAMGRDRGAGEEEGEKGRREKRLQSTTGPVGVPGGEHELLSVERYRAGSNGLGQVK